MKIIADLQLHSKYARAVSPNMVVPEIARWAAKKGIGLVATGDWTHPLWLRELEANLEEAAPGVFALRGPAAPSSRPTSSLDAAVTRRDSLRSRHPSVLFLLSTEVSCIYTQGGRARRIHILIFAPSFEVVHKINAELARRGANLMSDGRPIMGLSAKDVTELVLGVDENCLIIPAHAWTPWFSLYGSASGFDSIEECFGEYEKYIYAIETGLSSSPSMNWRIAELDSRNIVSFSDAHSPAKLGREATVFELPEVSYENIHRAIVNQGVRRSANQSISESARQQSGTPVHRYTDIPKHRNTGVPTPPTPRIAYTIEFYPEEGKYHYTGHRNCGVKHSPQETKKMGTVCTVCGKKLTVGVMHRVEELSKTQNSKLKAQSYNSKVKTDENGLKWHHHPEDKKPPYVMLVPLLEILSEALGVGTATQTVLSEYEKLTKNVGTEFEILMQTKPEDIERFSGPKVREAIMKVRAGDIFIDPGYDGEFGKVQIWREKDKSDELTSQKQIGLFE